MKSKEGLGEFITWVMSGGCKADIGEGGGVGIVDLAGHWSVHYPCWLGLSASPLVEIIDTVDNSAWPRLNLLYLPSQCCSCDEFSQALFFAAILLLCIIANAKRRAKNEVGLGTRVPKLSLNKSDISYLKTSRASDTPILSQQPFSVGRRLCRHHK